MPNPLTGDFEAVVQLSGRTVNRLLATMHQNLGSGKNLPTLPHGAVIRVGDQGFHQVVGGVRGTARVQISVPSIGLIDRTTDRFVVEAWIRARYQADPATAAFPEFVWGVVRAEYALSEVRHPRLGLLLRLDVVPDQVSFTSAGPDTSTDPQITEQVRHILARRVTVSPHKLIADFQGRRLRSLVGAGETAVAHPLSLGSTPTGGDITSVDRVFSAEDFAGAVSREYILSLIQPALNALKASNTTFTISVKTCAPPFDWPCITFSGTYHITIHTATVEWSPGGILTLRVAGDAKTDSIFPDASFSVEQKLALTFNAGTQTLSVAPSGPPSVSVDVNGPFGGLAEGSARSTVTNMFNAQLSAALATMGPKLQGALGQKQKLISQLQTLDDLADARFDTADFTWDGMTLQGTISLAPRRWIQAVAEKLADHSGYTALESWVPGGRIDRFSWHWFWVTTWIPVGTPPDGSQTHDDRFVLLPTTPVPGVAIPSGTDAPPKIPAGQICLTIRGTRINAQTGFEESVDNGLYWQRSCVYVVPTPPAPPYPDGAVKPLKRWWVLWAATVGGGSYAEAQVGAYVDADGEAAEPFNTLVHYLDDESAAASLAALEEGLREAAADDAGLLLTLVLREGLPERGGAELRSALDAFTERLEVPLTITEDVQAGWTQAYGITVGRGGAATRLLAADGQGSWAHDGPTDAAAIASALREYLLPSPPPRAELVKLLLRPGEHVPDVAVETGPGDWLGLDQLLGRVVTLTFVQPWARPSIAQLGRLQRTQERVERLGVVTVAVVDGLDGRGAAALATEHGLSFIVGGDPHGATARQFGIRAWPTTITIDAKGRLAAVEMGADPGAQEMLARDQSEAAVT